jgi:hypothetical protein
VPIYQIMALESVDLLSLLKRARSTTHARAAAESAAAAEAASATASLAATATAVAVDQKTPSSAPEPAKPLTPAVVGMQEEAELADLRAELLADEVLIQRILGLLYRRKKLNPNGGFISILDMEKHLGVEREGATFVMSYMKTTKVIEMDDKSRMAITVPGIDYLRGVLGLQSAPSSDADSTPE